MDAGLSIEGICNNAGIYGVQYCAKTDRISICSSILATVATYRSGYWGGMGRNNMWPGEGRRRGGKDKRRMRRRNFEREKIIEKVIIIK